MGDAKCVNRFKLVSATDFPALGREFLALWTEPEVCTSIYPPFSFRSGLGYSISRDGNARKTYECSVLQVGES